MKTWRWICAGLFLAMCLAGMRQTAQALELSEEEKNILPVLDIGPYCYYSKGLLFTSKLMENGHAPFEREDRDFSDPKEYFISDFIFFRPGRNIVRKETYREPLVDFYLVKSYGQEGYYVTLFAATPDGGTQILRTPHTYMVNWFRSSFGVSIRTDGNANYFIMVKMLNDYPAEVENQPPQVTDDILYYQWHEGDAQAKKLNRPFSTEGLTVLDAEERTDECNEIWFSVAYSEADLQFLHSWRKAKAFQKTEPYAELLHDIDAKEWTTFLKLCYPFVDAVILREHPAYFEGKVDERVLPGIFLIKASDLIDDPVPAPFDTLAYALDADDRYTQKYGYDELSDFCKTYYDIALPPSLPKMSKGKDVIWSEKTSEFCRHGTRHYAGWIEEGERYGNYLVLRYASAQFVGVLETDACGDALQSTYLLAEKVGNRIFPRYMSNDPMTPETVKSRYGIDLAEAKAAAEREQAEQAKAPKTEEKATKDSIEAAEAKKPASDAAASSEKTPAETEADAIRRAERKRVLTWVGVIAVVLLLVAVILWLFRRMRRLQDAVRRQNEAHSAAPAQGDDDAEGSTPRKGEDR